MIEKNIKAMYVHIPFCSSICSYCDFCKQFYDGNLVNKYLFSLEKEVNSRYNEDKLSTIYIGGGTPSCLSVDQLNKLFSILGVLNLESNYEFTIEVNVNDIEEDKLKLFKKAGVNRISIGVETVNEKFASFLNREINYDLILDKINLVKKYFDNINIDLMYGFFGEEYEDLDRDLSFIKMIDVSHVSIYSLIIEEHTKLYIDKVASIDEEKEANMYYRIVNYLKDIGYKHYEISNFAKDGCLSRHNITYWNNEEYYGVGLGASGYVNGVRYTNTRNINSYLMGKYVFTEEIIDRRTSMENEMIFGLRKIEGVNKKCFFEKYGYYIEQIFDIIDLLDRKLLMDNNVYLFIPEDKLYISNSILVNFIGGSNG